MHSGRVRHDVSLQCTKSSRALALKFSGTHPQVVYTLQKSHDVADTFNSHLQQEISIQFEQIFPSEVMFPGQIT